MNNIKPSILNAFLAVAALVPQQGLADEWLEKMTKQKACITGYQNALNRFERASQIWIADPQSPFQVSARFDRLLVDHKLYRDLIQKFAERYQGPFVSADDVLKQLRNLELQHPDIVGSLTELNDADDAFIKSVISIDEAFAQIADRFVSIRPTCANFAEDAVDAALANVGEIRQQLAKTQGYVTTAGKKRSDLFQSVYYGTKATLTDRYASLLGISLADAKNRLLTTLQAEKMLAKIQSWWLGTHGKRGFAEGTGGLQLQYILPLAEMKRRLMSGEVLDAEIQAQPGLTDEGRRSLRLELAPRLDALRSAIAALEARGPQGTRDLQVQSNARRRSMIDQYAAGCGESLNTFDALLANDESRSDYVTSETAYRDVVGACTRKSP